MSGVEQGEHLKVGDLAELRVRKGTQLDEGSLVWEIRPKWDEHGSVACVRCQCVRGLEGIYMGEKVDEKMAHLLHKVGLIMSVNILKIMRVVREESYKYRTEEYLT